MQFVARERLDVDRATVFAEFTDAGSFESLLAPRGVEVARDDSSGPLSKGSSWTLVFPYQGRSNKVKVRLTSFDPPESLEFRGEWGGLRATGRVVVEKLPDCGAELQVALDVTPETLKGRMLLQALRLGKVGFEERLRGKIAALAADIASRQSAGSA